MKGFALSRLPERFQAGPKTQVLADYIQAKYGAYGFKRAHFIEYNPEFKPDGSSKFSSDMYRWMENVNRDFALRCVGRSDEIIKLGHKGWYVDNYQDETVHGMVYQLPARNGECLYVPAVNDPNNDDSACLDFTSIQSDKEDAAKIADQMAEQWAEQSRIAQAKDQAEQRIAEIAEEITKLYQDFRRIAREIRANCDALKGISVVRELVKDNWLETKAEIRKLRREQRKIEENGIEY